MSNRLTRIKTRAIGKLNQVLNRYDGATSGRRAGARGWPAPSTGPNTDQRLSAPKLRARSRDLVRNNHIAKQALRTITTGVVGSGVIPHITSQDADLSARAENLIKHHFDTPNIDASGNLNLYGIQALAIHSMMESGDCLILRERRSMREMAELGLRLPFQLRVLEADYLCTEKDGQLPNGHLIYQGVEVDRLGRAVAYHLYEQHPGDVGYNLNMRVRRVPAEDVIHCFEILRPGQTRGVPELAPALLPIKNIKEYEDTQLIRQQVAACFSVFLIKNVDDGEPDDNQDYTVSPGIVRELKPGEDVKFADPPGVTGFGDYMRWMYRSVSSAMGITYEALTQDFSQVNYSSSRMAHISMHANFEQKRNKVVMSQMCHKLMQWTIEAMTLVPWERVTDTDKLVWTWTPPRREMLDPAKEFEAMWRAVRYGFRSRDAEILKLGDDPEAIDLENARGNERAESLGLIYDTMADKKSRAGLTQQPAEGDD